MNELQIMNLAEADVSTWDFELIKAELRQQLSLYASLVYTDETIKDAKKDRANLNKVKKVIADARKAYKAQCLAPYNAAEPQIRELEDMIEDHRIMIDAIVKDYEDRKREEKELAVRNYYDRKAVVLGDLAEQLYPMLFSKTWVAASTGQATYQEEIQEKIYQASQDIEYIRQMASPFVDTLLDVYVATLSLDEVERKQRELTLSAERAGLAAASAQPVSAPEPPPLLAPDPVIQMEEGSVPVRLYANQRQLDQLCDFMDAIGVRYEFL